MATAIGSLPHSEPFEAVDMILSLFTEAPFWPQLPSIDFREGMMFQYVEGLPGVIVDEKAKKVTLDIEQAVMGLDELTAAFDAGDVTLGAISPQYSQKLAAFRERLEAGLATAPVVLKGHVTGPVTLALGLETTFEERPAIYEPELARLVARLVGLKARFQELMFKELVPNAETLIFFDEPSMGSIGSAVLNLDADLCVEILSTAMSTCEGMPGIHCCGETDIGMLVDSGVEVINFDAYDYLDSVLAAGPAVRSFVEKGGKLAIGVVPSSLPHPKAVAEETVESLLARFGEVREALGGIGIDPQQLARQSFITPSCGTSGMSVELARKSLELTVEVARRAREIEK